MSGHLCGAEEPPILTRRFFSSPALRPLTLFHREMRALRKSVSVAAIRNAAVKTQQATVLLPKVPPFATNCLNVVLLRR